MACHHDVPGYRLPDASRLAKRIERATHPVRVLAIAALAALYGPAASAEAIGPQGNPDAKVTTGSEGRAEMRNWFDDPFFQISSAIPDCPAPRGPFVTDVERRAESHRRAEKGTTCWLAGQCDRPNAYAYDRDIAEAFRAGLARSHPAVDSTLWVRVQGRVVIIEGCARDEGAGSHLEAFARRLPYVEQAFANVRTDPTKRPPYRLRDGDPN